MSKTSNLVPEFTRPYEGSNGDIEHSEILIGTLGVWLTMHDGAEHGIIAEASRKSRNSV